MEVSGQLHAPTALATRKLPPVPSSSQIQSGRGGKEKSIPAPAWNRTPVVQPVPKLYCAVVAPHVAQIEFYQFFSKTKLGVKSESH
jgi:hypothetical protein